MAAADYYLCDMCMSKTFYDADVDYEYVSAIKCICPACSDMFDIIIKVKEDETT